MAHMNQQQFKFYRLQSLLRKMQSREAVYANGFC